MREPAKLFSVALPYTTFEKIRAVAKAEEISVGKTIRIAIDSFLDVRQGKQAAQTQEGCK